MPTWLWIVIVVVAVIVVIAVVASALRTKRSRALQERFGPEYDRVAADAPSRRDAESELRERQKRREELDIRPLDQSDRDRYRNRWQEVQAEFVDDPADAVVHADALIQEVMRVRGYPVEDFDTRSADSVAQLEQMGAVPVVGDVYDEVRLARLVAASEAEAVLHQLTTFGTKEGDPYAETIRVRIEGREV